MTADTNALWRRMGRTYWGDPDYWMTSKGQMVRISVMPMRQLVNTVKYVERHAAALLDPDAGEEVIRTYARCQCPPYATLVAALHSRAQGTIPLSTKDRERIEHLKSQLPAQWRARLGKK